MDFAAVAELCAPAVAAGTLHSIASVESSFNPYAIGVVGGRLQRQPKTLDEAIATAEMLRADGYDYSLGVVQVNQKNFGKYGLTNSTAFDPCSNLRAGSLILQDCYKRAGGRSDPMGDALSCYYSGNFTTGYRAGYVAKVKAAANQLPAAGAAATAIPVSATISRRRASTTAAPTKPLGGEPLFVSVRIKSTTEVASTEQKPGATTPGTALLF